jgi:hypothetical protein
MLERAELALVKGRALHAAAFEFVTPTDIVDGYAAGR